MHIPAEPADRPPVGELLDLARHIVARPAPSEVVIEAQRRFVRGGYYSVSEVRGEPRMREVLALRGMGELLELKLGRKGVELRLANAALPLMGVGLTQGLYELAFGIESRVTWSFSEEGLLEVSVSPWD